MKLNVELINKMIEKQGISFTSFAKRIGMTHTGLRSALANESMSLKNLIKLCEYFDKPIEYFFTNGYIGDLKNKVETEYYSFDYNNPGEASCKMKLLEIIDGLINENKRLFDYIKGLEKEKTILLDILRKNNKFEKGNERMDKNVTDQTL
jgi:transcriptional regulator with XRE-family HTH domain